MTKNLILLHPKQVVTEIKELLGAPTMGASFFINPVPASRPRVTRWGVYYGKNYTAWRKEAMELIKEQSDTIDLYVTVIVENIVKKPKTSKKDYPRGDVDNYAKAPLDVLTKKEFWTDDDIIVNLITSKRFAEPDEEERTEVSIYAHKDT